MLNYDEEDIFDVLDLDSPISQQNQYDYDLNRPQEDYDSFMRIRDEVKEKIEELPSTAQSQDHYGSDDQQQQDQEEEMEHSLKSDEITEQTPALFACQTTFEEISFSQQKLAQRKFAIQGYDYETQNLGRHLKSTTSSFLSLLIKTRELEPQEEDAAKQFAATNGAIEDFRRLFQVEGLCLRCREYYESQTFVQNMLNSPKLEFKSKIAMLRFLEKFRQMTFEQPQKWKMDSN